MAGTLSLESLPLRSFNKLGNEMPTKPAVEVAGGPVSSMRGALGADMLDDGDAAKTHTESNTTVISYSCAILWRRSTQKVNSFPIRLTTDKQIRNDEFAGDVAATAEARALILPGLEPVRRTRRGTFNVQTGKCGLLLPNEVKFPESEVYGSLVMKDREVTPYKGFQKHNNLSGSSRSKDQDDDNDKQEGDDDQEDDVGHGESGAEEVAVHRGS
ncbi:Uu.00g143740.m01.CDS01 [Anthostomella pinea]|uniref:Uu.00g143740.m01.CDS01 n=1 Tax=Anthostomella pinea TaxID=933095 RepID=A0AAI8YLK5_9PEZI|nr:Uu.00g143740.m01.CDS01 [Anthostomella pinea]